MTGLHVFIKGLRVTVNYLREAREGFDRSMCAAVVAQQGAPEIAQEMMAGAGPRQPSTSPATLHDFLQVVGLNGVPVRYGVVRL